ncbi:hypothetical protein CLV59_104107 [Chitinophaga dinghuensis]|uniref:PKD domain-containing protein n=1 Tax=Chitinophaga dinghuensis TaxID=1539050 RepID=A0A327VZH1_9BACT|nr:PKD domain-containing protein [Chitinophaga dinghuensis]RAJ81882.1 hypothetical protein CLV59_104107 [Chitinophaga dinghuensis]
MENSISHEMELVQAQLPALCKLLENNPNVLYVGVDSKRVNGEFTTTPALVVYVKKKMPIDQLSVSEQIPGLINGVLTDVSEPHKCSVISNWSELKPVKGGIGIQTKIVIMDSKNHNNKKPVPRGTLGCLVISNKTKEIMGLTNHHVVNFAEEVKENTKVAKLGVDSCEDEEIGYTWISKVGPRDENEPRGLMDAALIKLAVPKSGSNVLPKNTIQGLGNYVWENGSPVFKPGDEELKGSSQPIFGIGSDGIYYKNIERGKKVRKVGHKTGFTNGTVMAVDMLADPHEPNGVQRYYKHIMAIQADMTTGKYFSEEGDSGSVIVNDQNEVVGLLFAAELSSPSDRKPYSYATHIQQVLLAFDISIYQPPKAVINMDVDHQNSKRITFDASPSENGSGEIIAYLWRTGEFDSNGDEILNTSMTFDHTYADAGTYKVSLSVVSADHISNLAAAAVTITKQSVSGRTQYTTAVEKIEHTATEPLNVWMNELKQSPKGTKVADFIQTHQNEIRTLIHHNRRVMVAWQRKLGPYFLKEWYRALSSPEQPLIKEINGVSILSLLETTTLILEETGSPALQNDIRKYRLDLLNTVETFETLQQLKDSLLKSAD